MGVGSLVGRIPGWIRRPAVGLINSVDPLRLWVSRRIINDYAYRTPTRPRAVSMAADYTTWPGLVDRRFSGRHLEAVTGEAAPIQPDVERVVALFERKTFRRSTDTSLLFAFFAQWFVDSFLRTKWEEEGDGRQRFFRENESNHEIDLCQIYGIGEAQALMLREDRGGRLKTQEIATKEGRKETWPASLFEERNGSMTLIAAYGRETEQGSLDPAQPGLYTPGNFRRVYASPGTPWSDEDKRHAFAVGLEHGNSTLGNAAMNALFVREHNRTAGILLDAHPDWSDERVFQTARNVTIVVLLNIVIGDYIVHIAPVDVRIEAPPGMAEEERWYRNNWITVEFALLYRWHDLIPDSFLVSGETLPAPGLRRANPFLKSHGLGAILRAASCQHAGRIGLGNTAPFLIRPHAQGGADVKRLSLQMARACGLPSYNTYRRHYGLAPVASFEDLTRDVEEARRLRGLYGDINHLEWFVGLFAESYDDADIMGELLTTMVANDAFTQALTNPLLSKAVHNEATFGKEGLAIVRETRTLSQVIARNTEITDPDLFGFGVRQCDGP